MNLSNKLTITATKYQSGTENMETRRLVIDDTVAKICDCVKIFCEKMCDGSVFWVDEFTVGVFVSRNSAPAGVSVFAGKKIPEALNKWAKDIVQLCYDQAQKHDDETLDFDMNIRTLDEVDKAWYVSIEKWTNGDLMGRFMVLPVLSSEMVMN